MGMNWEDLPEAKKGNIGERLVNDYLISNGFIPYSPDTDGAHPFDRLVASRDKKTIFVADAKTKAKRKYYPDTGINVRNYNEYEYIRGKYGIEVFIFFVDEEAKEIYGNWMHELCKPTIIKHNGMDMNYPLIEKGIIYFPIKNTKFIVDIPEKEADNMAALSTKKECYKRIGDG